MQLNISTQQNVQDVSSKYRMPFNGTDVSKCGENLDKTRVSHRSSLVSEHRQEASECDVLPKKGPI
jgi:hypothetical protein